MTSRAGRLRTAGRACAAALLAAAAGAALAAAPPPDARARADALSRRAAARIAALQQEAEALATRERSILGDLRRLEVQRELQAARAAQAQAALRAVQAQIDAAGARIAALEQRAAGLRPIMNARLVDLYKLGRGGYARLLLSTPDLRNLGRAYGMVAALAAIDRTTLDTARRTLSQLQAARAALDARRVRMATLEAAARQAALAADRAAARRSQLLDRIDRRRDLNARLIGELQTAQQHLQAALATLATGAPAQVPALPIAPFRGALAWPVDGAVVVPFHAPPPAAGGAASGFVRDGIEIAAAAGTPVRVVHGGTVAFAGPFMGYGRLVIVRHGERDYSLYGDLDAVDVAKGAQVDAGQVLGTVGVPPAGGPAGLYFELQIDGRAADPLQWLKARR